MSYNSLHNQKVFNHRLIEGRGGHAMEDANYKLGSVSSITRSQRGVNSGGQNVTTMQAKLQAWEK